MEIWIVACAAGALLVRVGLALYNCGLVRAKNAGGALLRHVADLCLAALAFWAVGIALLAGEHFIELKFLFGVRGQEYQFIGPTILGPYLFVMLAAALIATGVVVGALSERSRFWPSLVPSVVLAGALVPIVARWTSDGWLGRRGFHDFAGGSFVHLVAGLTAAVGAIFVGPRGGKYNRDGSSNVIPGHNLPLAGAGAMLMFVGWFFYLLAFVGARTYMASIVATNAILAAAAAGVASLIVAQLRYGKPDIYLALTGVLGGIVSITAGADTLNTPSAVLTGAVAGALISWLLLRIDLVWKLDDPTGALAIHGVGGAWSLLAAGLFGSARIPMARVKLIGVQLLGIAAVAVMVIAVAGVLFFLIKKVTLLRSREADEFDGLDLAEHDIGSYPDFQQTMIKSYHLREA